MYDINDCYKIIFEAMAENLTLNNIAEQIYGYTGKGIAFISGSGRLMASAGFEDEQTTVSFLEKDTFPGTVISCFSERRKQEKAAFIRNRYMIKRKYQDMYCSPAGMRRTEHFLRNWEGSWQK